MRHSKDRHVECVKTTKNQNTDVWPELPIMEGTNEGLLIAGLPTAAMTGIGLFTRVV